MQRRFVFIRDEDETGISGEGLVVEGVQYSDGHCAYRWMTEHQTDQLAEDIERLHAIHGHGGRTRIVFLDTEGGAPIPEAIHEVHPLSIEAQARWGRYCPGCGALKGFPATADGGVEQYRSHQHAWLPLPPKDSL
jgi:hypothetical protein